jgi:hypothetical protein
MQVQCDVWAWSWDSTANEYIPATQPVFALPASSAPLVQSAALVQEQAADQQHDGPCGVPMSPQVMISSVVGVQCSMHLASAADAVHVLLAPASHSTAGAAAATAAAAAAAFAATVVVEVPAGAVVQGWRPTAPSSSPETSTNDNSRQTSQQPAVFKILARLGSAYLQVDVAECSEASSNVLAAQHVSSAPGEQQQQLVARSLQVSCRLVAYSKVVGSPSHCHYYYLHHGPFAALQVNQLFSMQH